MSERRVRVKVLVLGNCHDCWWSIDGGERLFCIHPCVLHDYEEGRPLYFGKGMEGAIPAWCPLSDAMPHQTRQRWAGHVPLSLWEDLENLSREESDDE